MSLHDEAEKCRHDARALAGKPEAPFLMRLASAFEELALMTEDLSRRANYLKNAAVTGDTHATDAAAANVREPDAIN